VQVAANLHSESAKPVHCATNCTGQTEIIVRFQTEAMSRHTTRHSVMLTVECETVEVGLGICALDRDADTTIRLHQGNVQAFLLRYVL